LLGKSVAVSEEKPEDELAVTLTTGIASTSEDGGDATPEIVLSESVERCALNNTFQ
jgi:hypothetical protein